MILYVREGKIVRVVMWLTWNGANFCNVLKSNETLKNSFKRETYSCVLGWKAKEWRHPKESEWLHKDLLVVEYTFLLLLLLLWKTNAHLFRKSVVMKSEIADWWTLCHTVQKNMGFVCKGF